MEITKAKRIEWVDYVKTFACFLVVLGHLLQSLQKSNLDNYVSITGYINWFIYLFHMPLFMCMSGFFFFFKNKRFSWNEYKEFEKKKIINLSIPYITFYLLFLGINIIFSSQVNTPKGIEELKGIINNPMPPYWFLYALLSIFILIPILEKVLNHNKKNIFTLLCILKIIAIFWNSKIYFISSFMKYAIYFYLGAFIKEETKNKNIQYIFAMIIYIVCSMILFKYENSIEIHIIKFIKIIFALGGIMISVNLLRNIKLSKILDIFKKYTFQIYLTHTIFCAGIRILLLKLNVNNYFIHLILGMGVGMFFPVAISLISNKIKYTNFFFYPLKTIEELKERKDKNVREET